MMHSEPFWNRSTCTNQTPSDDGPMTLERLQRTMREVRQNYEWIDRVELGSPQEIDRFFRFLGLYNQPPETMPIHGTLYGIPVEQNTNLPDGMLLMRLSDGSSRAYWWEKGTALTIPAMPTMEEFTKQAIDDLNRGMMEKWDREARKEEWDRELRQLRARWFW